MKHSLSERITRYAGAGALAITVILLWWKSPASLGLFVECLRARILADWHLSAVGTALSLIALYLLLWKPSHVGISWLFSGAGLILLAAGYPPMLDQARIVGGSLPLGLALFLFGLALAIIAGLSFWNGCVRVSDAACVAAKLQVEIDSRETELSKTQSELTQARADVVGTKEATAKEIASYAKERTFLANQRTEMTELENSAKAKIISAERKAREAEERELVGNVKRLYESQLIGVFLLALGFAWWSRKGDKRLALNFHQGNLDRDLADLLGETESHGWLVEFKREWKDVPLESKKERRISQFAALQTNDAQRIVGGQCHWLGWGDQSADDVIIRMSSYWATWKGDETARKSAFTHESFAQRAFPSLDDQAKACKPSSGSNVLEGQVGVSLSELESYMAFLLKNTGSSSESSENAPVFFIYRRANGDVRYTLSTSLDSLSLEVKRTRERLDRERNDRGYGGRGH